MAYTPQQGGRPITVIDQTTGGQVNVGDAATNSIRVSGTVGAGLTEPVSIDDNSGTLTVDAPVSTPVAMRLSNGSSFQDPYIAPTDDATFNPSSDKVLMFGSECDEVSPDLVDEGDAGALRMSTNRNLYVRIRDNGGNERGLNINASGEAAISNTVLAVVGGGTEATAQRVTLANNSTGIVGATQSGTWTIQPGNTPNTTPWYLRVPQATRSDTYAGTGSGVTVDVSTIALRSYAIQVRGTGASATTWDVRLEGSLDNGATFSQILQHTNTDGDTAVKWSGATLSPSLYFRSRCAGLVLGGATNIVVTILGTQ